MKKIRKILFTFAAVIMFATGCSSQNAEELSGQARDLGTEIIHDLRDTGEQVLEENKDTNWKDILSGNSGTDGADDSKETQDESGTGSGYAGTYSAAFDISSVPEYSGNPYYVVNGNVPFFTENDMTTDPFEYYSDLDSLGRCGVAYANVCIDIMPTEERGEIGMVKPSGWHTVKYDNVDGKYLYNRCHLIGYQLAGENANEKNLITGTRYMNVDGMLPFENMVDDYAEETDNHILYRVTPVFEGNNLLASGVLMEAKSVEDGGSGIEFCVYCYNVQPGIVIDYATGDSYSEY